MHRIKKGQIGYIQYKRKSMILFTIFIFAVALGIYFGAMDALGTNQNVFTFLAILLLLPASRYTVNTIMFFKAKGCSQEVYTAVEEHIGSLTGAYELYMTAEKKNFALSHLTIAGKNVVALTEDEKCDTAAGEQHILSLMKTNGFLGYHVKIFSSLSKYENRLDQLNRLEGEDAGKGHEKLLSLMLSISL